MELTEELLIRIAGHIANLSVHVSTIREVLVQMGTQPEALDQAIEDALTGPVFQEARALVLEDLREGLVPSD